MNPTRRIRSLLAPSPTASISNLQRRSTPSVYQRSAAMRPEQLLIRKDGNHQEVQHIIKNDQEVQHIIKNDQEVQHIIKIKLNRGKTLNKPKVVPKKSKPSITGSQEVVGGCQPEKLEVVDACQPEKLKDLEENTFELKLEASKTKLHERYQQAQAAKKRVRVLDLKDVPKQELLDGSSNKKPKSRNRW